MKNIVIGGEINASAISLGCMRIWKLADGDAKELIKTALDEGINFFDNADIYGKGASEEVFAKALKANTSRQNVIIQTKCGIRKGYYDFSKEYILESVEGSLKRLSTDYIDILLLHRPDALMEPEEVAEAFDRLQSSGKVRWFGVSNQNPMQIELLSRYLRQKLLVNQLQLSIVHTGMVDVGINVNTQSPQAIVRDGGVLDYCRLKDITVQAWSPFQYGAIEGVFLDNEKFPEVNQKVNEIASLKGVTNTTIAAAWILRHPAGIQVIPGTMNKERLKDICKATAVELSRKEWYEIYLSAGNPLP